MFDLKKITDPYRNLTGTEAKKEERGEGVREETAKIEEKKPAETKKRGKTTISDLRLKDRTLGFSLFTKLAVMMKKDAELLVRSKTSSLVILLGPLLIILLVGLAFNTSSLYDLRIATYSDSYSDLSASVIEDLKDQQYNTIKVDSQEDCMEGVKLGTYHVCAVFPADMQVSNEANNIVDFYVDESRMNLAYLISSSVFSKIVAKSSELSKGITQNLLETLDSTKNELTTKKKTLSRLSGSYSDTKLRLMGIKDEFSELDLEYNKTEINFTSVEDEMEKLEDQLNTTDIETEQLEESLNYLRIGINTVAERLTKTRDVKENSIKEIDSIKGNLDGDIQHLTEIDKSFDIITNNINSLAVTDVENIVSPVKTSIKTVVNEKTHLGNMFPTLMIIVIMFVSILLSSTMMIREKLSRAYFRNFITPTNDLMFMFGSYLTNIIIVMLQMGVIVGASAYFFKNEILSVLPELMLSLFAIGSVFVLLGMFLGFLFKSEETSILGAISVSSLMLFFSNTVLPIETLPVYIRNVARFNPFVISEIILKRLMLFQVDLGVIALPLYMLLCFIAIFFVLSFVTRELTKRNL